MRRVKRNYWEADIFAVEGSRREFVEQWSAPTSDEINKRLVRRNRELQERLKHQAPSPVAAPEGTFQIAGVRFSRGKIESGPAPTASPENDWNMDCSEGLIKPDGFLADLEERRVQRLSHVCDEHQD